ncbi:MAG: metal ABC transporter ATP-binding protein [Chlamydiae bacterium]|nr:metal ABC transporter ATP-binding protein [Chlamydiota bacterium]
MSEVPALSVKQLTVNYDKVPVLWDINFSIPAGNIVGVIGPNGAGKSTLLKAILQMIDPLSGKVEFFGLPFKKARKKIAYVPQRSSIDWDFPITAIEVVMMGLYARLGLFSWISAKEKKQALDALELVGMTSFANRQISQLSGGQQQRIFIARALLQDADIYFMDEPFAGVDISTEQSIMQLLRQLKAKGKTLFIVHHDLNTVKSYFDWVIMLNTSLVACGPVGEVCTDKALNEAYGKGSFVLDEAVRLSLRRSSGLK